MASSYVCDGNLIALLERRHFYLISLYCNLYVCTLVTIFNRWLLSKDMIKEVLLVFHWLTFRIVYTVYIYVCMYVYTYIHIYYILILCMYIFTYILLHSHLTSTRFKHYMSWIVYNYLYYTSHSSFSGTSNM